VIAITKRCSKCGYKTDISWGQTICSHCESPLPDKVLCPYCGRDNYETVLTCSGCGAELWASSSAHSSMAVELPSASAAIPSSEFDGFGAPTMKQCPQCNTKLLNSAVACDCGYSFPDDTAASVVLPERQAPIAPTSTPPPATHSQTALPVASKDELQAFIQTRSYYYLPKWEALDPRLHRAASGTFNWAACFLTAFWMAYRKMYLYVIVWVAFLFVFYSVLELVFTLPMLVTNGASIAMMYLFGRYGSSLYRRHVERKIQQIKTTMMPEYWAQAFRDKGGTNAWATIPLILLHVFTLYGMYLIIVERAR
jgi:hypothetical protein